MSNVEDGKVPNPAAMADETFVEDVNKQEPVVAGNRPPQHEIYDEALLRYPTDEHIDRVAEAKLRRKLDFKILPLLSVCYFFYVSLRQKSLTFVGTVWQSNLTKSHTRCSMSTKPRSHTPPFSASRKILISPQKTTHGCRPFFTSAGWHGPSRLTSSCSAPRRVCTFPSTSFFGGRFSSHRRARRTSPRWQP